MIHTVSKSWKTAGWAAFLSALTFVSVVRAEEDAQPTAPVPAPAAVAVDAEAPEFTLKDHEDHDFRLKDLRGRRHVLLAFFPRAFTPG